jgi:hypothetical protein
MAQLKQDEWPKDHEPTTDEAQVELTERDVRGSEDEPATRGTTKTNRPSDEDDDLLNVDPDSAVD